MCSVVTIIRLFHPSSKVVKLLLMIIFALLSGSAPAISQSEPIISSGVVDDHVSLTFKVEGIKYSKRNKVFVSYQVINMRNQDIYLVVSEDPMPSYDPSGTRLGISVNKVIFDYHHFEFPKLQRLKPRQSYQGKAELSLEFLKDNFRSGEWLLYLSVGYLDNRGMAEIHNLLKEYRPSGLVKEFDHLQNELRAGPVEIELFAGD